MNLGNFFKNKWTTIERVVLQSPNTLIDDPLIIEIQVKGTKSFRKVVVRQVFDDDATEADKSYYLTQYLLVVEYIDAVNAGKVHMPCHEFLKLANAVQFDDEVKGDEDDTLPSTGLNS